MIGTAPIKSCQPANVATGMVHRKRFIITVPSAQEIAAPSISAAPSGAAPKLLKSGPISTARPAMPSARPSNLVPVKASPSTKRLNKAAQTGMVKAMIEARPASIMLTP